MTNMPGPKSTPVAGATGVAPQGGIAPALLIETLKSNTEAVHGLAQALVDAIAPAILAHAQATEATAQGVSTNFFAKRGNGASMQVTLRLPHAEQYEQLVDICESVVTLLEARGYEVTEGQRGGNSQVRPAPAQVPAQAPAQAKQPAPKAQGASTNTVTIDTIVVTVGEDGNPRYKGKGGPFQKFGLTIWPEVLPKIGVNAEGLSLGPNKIEPILVTYALNEEGKATKVIGLA